MHNPSLSMHCYGKLLKYGNASMPAVRTSALGTLCTSLSGHSVLPAEAWPPPLPPNSRHSKGLWGSVLMVSAWVTQLLNIFTISWYRWAFAFIESTAREGTWAREGKTRRAMVKNTSCDAGWRNALFRWVRKAS